jgi:hydroxypyruvate isomerase
MSAWKLPYAGHLGVRGPRVPLFRHLATSVDPVDQIAFLADIGFSGVQDNGLSTREPREQEQIGTALANRGLCMGSFVHDPAHWQHPSWTSTDRESRAALTRQMEISVAAAGRAGGRVVTCVSAADERRSRAGQLSAMADNLAFVAPRAEQVGLILAIEVLTPRRVPTTLLRSLDEALAIVTAVGSPAIGLMFDTGHFALTGEDVPGALRRAAKHVVGLQAVDVRQAVAARVAVGGALRVASQSFLAVPKNINE